MTYTSWLMIGQKKLLPPPLSSTPLCVRVDRRDLISPSRPTPLQWPESPIRYFILFVLIQNIQNSSPSVAGPHWFECVFSHTMEVNMDQQLKMNHPFHKLQDIVIIVFLLN